MKIKKWLAGAVLSLCLLMNTLAMPAASAGTLGDMVAERFPSTGKPAVSGKLAGICRQGYRKTE